MNTNPLFNKVCIIGAKGNVGSFLSKFFSEISYELISIDTAYEQGGNNCYCLDLRNATPEERAKLLTETDIIVLALANVYLFDMLDIILPYLTNRTVLIDTSSTKLKVAHYYEKNLDKYNFLPQILSINPLFKPQTNLKGKSIAYFSQHEQSMLKKVLNAFSNHGYHLIECTAHQHDQALSINQVAVHILILLFGRILAETHINIDKLLEFSTPPARILLLLVHRLVCNTPKVYWDIQHDNFFSDDIRRKLAAHLEDFSSIISNEDYDGFCNRISSIDLITKARTHEDNIMNTFSQVVSLIDQNLKDRES